MGVSAGRTRGRSNGVMIRLVHRWLGAAVAAFVLVLAATGVMLNHSGGLDLAGRYVASDAVLGWYGIDPPEVETGYRLASDGWLVQAAGQVFLNGNRIAVERGAVVGAVELPEPAVIAVAFPETLYLFTLEGELIEQLDRADALPQPLERIGVAPAGRLVVQTRRGRFEADRQLTGWSESDAQAVRWARPSSPPSSLAREAATAARRHLISWERLLLDLHSGRLFGPAGVWLFDLAAVVLLVLAGSGLYVWLKTPGRRRD